MKKLPESIYLALETIQDFCIKQLDRSGDGWYPDGCKDCPLHISRYGKEANCFFRNLDTPEEWEIEENFERTN